MPLRRSKIGEAGAAADAVYFPMEDAKTGKPVVCKASYEYLRQRTGVDEEPTSLLAMLTRLPLQLAVSLFRSSDVRRQPRCRSRIREVCWRAATRA
jgi:hypothetical protein